MKNKRSRLAVSSFIWSLLPIILPVTIVLIALIFTDFMNDIGTDHFVSFLGIVAYYSFVIIGIWSSILSIILGVIALFRIKKNNLDGKYFAIGGIVISLIMLVIFYFISSGNLN